MSARVEPERPGELQRQRLHLLSNGRYSVLLSPAGGGYSAFERFAITRWAPDPARDTHGFFLYLRDRESGRRWSAGLAPSYTSTGRYMARFEPARARFASEVERIDTVTDIVVATGVDAELRRVRITNRSDRRRRIELTSYVEVVLQTPAADAGHPAFSKLFVQTDYLPEHRALIAWRRPRSPDDPVIWTGHRLLVQNAGTDRPELETDRARFLGRGRSSADPSALDSALPLSGTLGNVLDPIFSLRETLEIDPGGDAEVVAVLAAARSRDALTEALARFDRTDSIAAVFEGAAPAAPDAALTLGLSDRWLERLRIDTADWDAEPPPLRAEPGAPPKARASHAAPAAPASPGPEPSHAGENLHFFNGFGGFSSDGREYVIRIETEPAGGALRLPPAPWCNVIANEKVGALVSERGAGFTWSVNSRENRLTPWSNDPVLDPHGEALYLRDEESGALWSPVPGPAPAAAPYEVRHGFGYTKVRHHSHGIDQEVLWLVPRRDPVRIVRVRLENCGDRPRHLSLAAYAQLVLGGLACETRGRIHTSYDASSGAVLARNPNRGEFSDRVTFAAAVGSGPGSFTTDRAAFLGPHGDLAAPAALASPERLDGRTGDGFDACAAFRVPLTLEPGATAEVAFLLGEAESPEQVGAVIGRYAWRSAIDEALQEIRDFWGGLLGRVRIRTPSTALDLMVNGWLSYQNLSCRMWGRSAFYQSGGAYGYRDQLQDASALVYLQPELTRRQILLHAEHQFVEGDVMHWWHPPTSKGIRTRFSDDLLWLPYITVFYVQRTGDGSVLDAEAGYLAAPLPDEGEDERFLLPQDSGERGTVYEHCCRALDRSLAVGSHGLPLMGTGDWNDGMNRVGREGRGESVWLGFFLLEILDDFIPICKRRGDLLRAERYREHRGHLESALNATGWDGEWYRRAYYDNGAALGSAENDECRIDALAQAWAVISGAAPPERAALALDAVERDLVSEDDGLIRLLAPAFDRTPHDPGYIKGYLPGVRENGGQYTHAALWVVRALAGLGRGNRAARLLEMLSPVTHTRTEEDVAVYRVEPYVIAADVYGVQPHVGRGGWTWYTGSAGWMFRVALESILGLELRDGRVMALRPCLPGDWPWFSLEYRLPDGETHYRIEVERAPPGEVTTLATLDGNPVAVDDGAVIIPLLRDGAEHQVQVRLGADVGPRYVAGAAPTAERSP